MLDWVSLAKPTRLILSARVGKQTDKFIEALVLSTKGKTAGREWDTNGWGGYEPVFTSEVEHYIGKALTQLNERINPMVRQQTG